MILSKTKLMGLVEEELNKTLSEANFYRDEKGRLSSCRPGRVLSLTKAGADSEGLDPKYVRRGVVSSCEDEADKTKISSTNDSSSKPAGRKTMSGKDVTPKHRVKGYDETYTEDVEMLGSEPIEELEQNTVLNLKLSQILRMLSKAAFVSQNDL